MLEQEVIRDITQLITTISEKYDVEENKIYTFTCDFICEGKDLIRIIQVGVTEKDTK